MKLLALVSAAAILAALANAKVTKCKMKNDTDETCNDKNTCCLRKDHMGCGNETDCAGLDDKGKCDTDNCNDKTTNTGTTGCEDTGNYTEKVNMCYDKDNASTTCDKQDTKACCLMTDDMGCGDKATCEAADVEKKCYTDNCNQKPPVKVDTCYDENNEEELCIDKNTCCLMTMHWGCGAKIDCNATDDEKKCYEDKCNYNCTKDECNAVKKCLNKADEEETCTGDKTFCCLKKTRTDGDGKE
jgi:hypothetical protein